MMTNEHAKILIFFVLAGFAAAAGIFVFQGGDDSAIELARHDEGISWQTEKPGGITEEELREKVQNLKEEYEESGDVRKRYSLALSLANQYRYLGEGKKAFEYLNTATQLRPEKSVAYMNAGDLLAKLGATTTARQVYEKGVSMERAHAAQNYLLLLDFYTSTPGIPEEDISKGFEEALSETGGTENILKMYAQWNEDIGNTEKAIELWTKVLEYAPDNSLAVEKRIDTLKSSI